MELLSLELSKKLNYLGILENIDTEFCYYSTFDNREYFMIGEDQKIKVDEYYYIGTQDEVSDYKVYKKYKTLPISDVIFTISNIKKEISINIHLVNGIINLACFSSTGECLLNVTGTLIGVTEELINYLLDNRLK